MESGRSLGGWRGALAPYLSAFAADLPFYGFITAYGVVAAWLGVAYGVPHKFVPLSYMQTWPTYVVGVGALYLSTLALLSLRAPRPLQALGARLRAVISPSTLAGALMFLGLAVFCGLFSSTKTMLTDIASFRWDPLLADLDAAIHGGRDPWLYLQFAMNQEVLWIMKRLYSPIWMVVCAGTMLAATMHPALKAVRAQYLWTYLLMWVLLGNVVALMGMSAGPILYFEVTGDPRFKALADFTAGGPDDWRAALWRAYTTNTSGAGMGISAFPSLHLASTTLFALLAYRAHKLAGHVMVAYLVVILVGSVYLAWHYAIDGYVSILATLAIWVAVGRAQAFAKRAASAPAPIGSV